MTGKKKGTATILKEYFGYREGDNLKAFRDELNALSSEEKLELAIGAAKNLGYEQEYVDFSLS